MSCTRTPVSLKVSCPLKHICNATFSTRFFLNLAAISNAAASTTENDEQLDFTHAQEYKGKVLYDNRQSRK